MSTASKRSKEPKYEIGGSRFFTRQELEEFIRAMVRRYEDGVSVGPEDQQFLESLFRRHPDADLKFGDGVVSIEVRSNKAMYGKSRGFWIQRADGSCIDISWTTCIDGSIRNSRRDFYSAARAEIAQQRQHFRDSYFLGKVQVECPLTGQRITRSKCHVDHVAPKTFQALADQWLAENNLRPEDIKTMARENGIDDAFCDRHLAEKWQHFHRTNAVLRVVSKLGNLSHAKIK